MDLIVLLLVLVGALAIVGMVAEAFGTDSREGIEDTHAGHRTGRTI